MTTYTTISNASVAVGAIPSSTTVTALRDNPLAIAESANGAPIMISSWHPYDKVTVGDGKDGVIYDFSVNGAQTEIVSPDFVDGYEYRFFGRVDNISTIDLYRQTTADYQSVNNIGYGLDTWFNFVLPLPRVSRGFHYVTMDIIRSGNLSPVSVILKAPTSGSPSSQKILRLRFSCSLATTTGKIWMFRQREFASSP